MPKRRATLYVSPLKTLDDEAAVETEQDLVWGRTLVHWQHLQAHSILRFSLLLYRATGDLSS